MIITKSWINAHKTKAGSWNRAQIEALGLEYPPRKGWQKRLEGVEINPHQRLAFESQAGTQSKGTKFDQQFKNLVDRVSVLERQLASMDKA